MLVFYVLWVYFIYDTPDVHPWITQKEKSYMKEQIGTSISKKTMPLPVKSIVTSVPFLALLWAHFANMWGIYFIATNGPKYLPWKYLDSTWNRLASDIYNKWNILLFCLFFFFILFFLIYEGIELIMKCFISIGWLSNRLTLHSKIRCWCIICSCGWSYSKKKYFNFGTAS